MSSVRHRILQNLEERFRTVTAGSPDDNPYTLQWSEVTRKAIKSLSAGRRAVLGIYPGTEEKSVRAGMPITMVAMDIVLEAHITKDAEDIADLVETALLEMERVIMEDQTCGGLAVNIETTSSDTDIDGMFATHATAALYMRVQFRHKQTDPGSQDYGD